MNELLLQAISLLPEIPSDTQFVTVVFHTCLELLHTCVGCHSKSEHFHWTQTHSLLIRLALHLGNPSLSDHSTHWTEFLVSFLQYINSSSAHFEDELRRFLTCLFEIDLSRTSLADPHGPGRFSYLPLLVQAIGQSLNNLSSQTSSSFFRLFDSCLPKSNFQYVPHLHLAVQILWPFLIRQYESDTGQPSIDDSTPIMMSLLHAVPSDEVYNALAAPLSILTEKAMRSSANKSPFIVLSCLLDRIHHDRSVTSSLVAECIFRIVVTPLWMRRMWTQWDTPTLDWFRALFNLWCDCVSMIHFESSELTIKQSVLAFLESDPLHEAMIQLPELHYFIIR